VVWRCWVPTLPEGGKRLLFNGWFSSLNVSPLCGDGVQNRGFPFVEGVFFGLEELREWNCLRQKFEVSPKALVSLAGGGAEG